MNTDSLLEILIEERMNTALEQALSTDTSYRDTCEEINEQLKELDKTKLNESQKSAVDKVLSAYNFNSSEYGRSAYRQGYKDCLMLIQELYQLRQNL